jgi:Lipocalin-like domain
MHRWPLLIAPFLLVTPALAQSENSIVGTWKLVSATQIENGQAKEYFGPRPLGQSTFDASGHFSIILLRSDLPKFHVNDRDAGTADENAAVVKGSIAFFGTYSLSGDTLKIHIDGSTFPNWNDANQTRMVHLSGDQFTWENAAASAGGSAKLVYQRVK